MKSFSRADTCKVGGGGGECGRVWINLDSESQMLCFCFLGTGICLPPPISLLLLSGKAAECMSILTTYAYARIMLSYQLVCMLVYV
jgi:hypothetical protein